MYEGMFVDNEPIYQSPVIVTNENRHQIKKSRIGEYEKDILCDDCEQKLLGHYYDDYVASICNGNSIAYDTSIRFDNYVSEMGFEFVSISNIDAERFKIFLLSVLFRVSVSQRTTFKYVILDKSVEAEIRDIILNKRLLTEFNIYCNILCYQHLDLEFGKILGMPATIKLNDDLVIYSMLINGFIYMFYWTNNINHLSERIKFLAFDNIKIHMLKKDEAIKLIFAHFGIETQQPT